MSKWTTVRVDKATAERLRALAGDGSISSLLERLSLPRGFGPVDGVVTDEPTAPVADVVSPSAPPLAAPEARTRPEGFEVMFTVPKERESMMECIQAKVDSIGSDCSRTQPVRKPSPFEARAEKRKAAPTIKTNEFGDVVYDD